MSVSMKPMSDDGDNENAPVAAAPLTRYIHGRADARPWPAALTCAPGRSLIDTIEFVGIRHGAIFPRHRSRTLVEQKVQASVVGKNSGG